MLEQVDFSISLGGDGTLLNMARTAFKYDVPVLGINLGTVGFLADVEIDDIESAIKALSKDNYDLKTEWCFQQQLFVVSKWFSKALQ